MPETLLLNGETIISGICIGKAYIYRKISSMVSRKKLKTSEIYGEIKRYEKALNKVKNQIISEAKRVKVEIGTEQAEIIESHILITDDPFFKEEVPRMIEKQELNAEKVILDGLGVFIDAFQKMEDPYMRERGKDIEDVALRIIRVLSNSEEYGKLYNIRGILVAQELKPSMVTNLNPRLIKGIITEFGGETSHAVILAKSLNIPLLINVKNATTLINQNDTLIIDGLSSQVVVNPDQHILNNYREKLKEYRSKLKTIEKTKSLPSVTKDGTKILLMANIDMPGDTDSAIKYGAEGVGLFRTELPFIIENRILSEEEQFKLYRDVIKKMKDKIVTIRTLDIGGDKFLPFSETIETKMANPFLSLRSVRISILKPDVFRVQIRAILRASIFGKTRILIPLISSYEEMEKIFNIIDEEKANLEKSGIPYDRKIERGIMIEVPSAAILADQLIKRCDFFSIGTNDLIQYTLAVDRTDESVAEFYVPESPAVLRLISYTAKTAIKEDKPCAVCGELAGNPIFTPFFIGVGIRELSMEPNLIPQVKLLIRECSISDVELFAEEVLSMRKADRIREAFREFCKKYGLLLL